MILTLGRVSYFMYSCGQSQLTCKIRYCRLNKMAEEAKEGLFGGDRQEGTVKLDISHK